MVILIISSAIFIIGLIIITILHNQHGLDITVRPVPPPAPSGVPLVSVMVPARDEERNIRRCVESLLAQTYPNFEVIVLEDRSTDLTPSILEEIACLEERLRVIRGGELPPGWAGKPHALHQAAQAAKGKWFCFVDADTFVSPAALASVYAAAQEQSADMFSIFTRQVLGSFWERVILPLVFTALSVGFTPRKVNDPSRPDAIANGQFIFIKRSVYQATGGHAAIKASIVEDRDLALLIKRAGYRLVVADGREVASTRMYTSLSEMWEGWTKNIFLGLRDRPGLLLLGAFGAFVSFFAAVLLPVWLIAGLIWWSGDGGTLGLVVAVEAFLLWAYLVAWRAIACAGMDVPVIYALFTPLGAGIFALMMVASAWKVLSGRGVTWKGRRYAGR
jgi:chlorobactene glucosyltransferase